MDELILKQARELLPEALETLREAIRIPADYVDLPADQGGDPSCGLSNHEGPRLEYLRRRIIELGAVDGPEDVGFDDFGNLWWQVEDKEDGIASQDKTVILFDGHTDTVQALRESWHEVHGGGLDPYQGLLDVDLIDRELLREELGHLPPESEWQHLLWGRGSADQLGGVICQIIATRILRDLRSEGSLRGVIVRSYGTVAEEDNDGGGPMFIMREDLPRGGAERVPDVVILTEGTGSAALGQLGIYRGQRGRMQIEVEVTGKSCHGSMPWEGRNPLEYGARILTEATEQYARGDGFSKDDFLGSGSRTASFATLDTPSDCAVPERFTFRFDRRLTAGEDPSEAVASLDSLPAVSAARAEGLKVEVRVPIYNDATWKGYRPGNAQIYPGWVTPEQHPAIVAATETYRRVIAPLADEASPLRAKPRVDRWVFSTDGVGVPLPIDGDQEIPDSKRWIQAGAFRHPAMFGIGPGVEENTHKLGECVDMREIPAVVAFYARFPSLYRERTHTS